MTHQLQADDRVLVLQAGSHSTARLREWARALPQGLLVGLGDPSAIRNARRELADCENVLFASGSRQEIPWRDGFFTVILDVEGGAGKQDETADVTVDVTEEMLRVLHPSGRIYSIEP
jgi:hypothetical protein